MLKKGEDFEEKSIFILTKCCTQQKTDGKGKPTWKRGHSKNKKQASIIIKEKIREKSVPRRMKLLDNNNQGQQTSEMFIVSNVFNSSAVQR